MKIRSEYDLLEQCVESGIAGGYTRAFKHTNTPSEDLIKITILEYIMCSISEMFIFSNEEKD